MTPPGLEGLFSLIDYQPIPLARPDLPRADESLGLTFLSLVLRLPHLARITESLKYLDQHNLKRSLALDIDLRALDADERELLRVRSYDSPRTRDDDGADLWIPVSRYSRRDLAPVTVRDASGDVVPRLTHRATSAATAAGLVGLFKVLVQQIDAATHTPSSARWLVESAIQQLVTLGQESVPLARPASVVDARMSTADDGTVDDGDVDDDQAAVEQRIRAQAKGLARLVAVHAAAFPTLLRLAAQEYLLVVMLPEEPAQSHITFEAPVVRSDDTAVGPSGLQADRSAAGGAAQVSPASDEADEGPAEDEADEAPNTGKGGRPRVARWRGLRVPQGLADLAERVRRTVDQALADGEDFHFEYTTQLPRSLASYHVTVEVAEDIRIRRCLLKSDADSVQVDSLLRDMRSISGTSGETAGEPDVAVPEEVLHLELSRILSALADLGRRRMYDLRAYQEYLKSEERPAGQSGPDITRGIEGPDRDDPLAALAAGRCSLQVLLGLADLEAQGSLNDCLRDEGTATPARAVRARLAEAAVQLRAEELHQDVHAENDPREHGAHAQWRHRPAPFGAPTLEPITATIVLALADEDPALVDSVKRMVTALLLVVSGLAVLLAPAADGTATIQSDAIVAVLLLVPGIMLARLDIPNTHSVLGQMRAGARRRAYASVTITSALAVVIAAASNRHVQLAFSFAAAIALACVLYAVTCNIDRRAASRDRDVPDAHAAPRWLYMAVERPETDQRRRADERFGVNLEYREGGGPAGDDLGLRLGASLAQRGALAVWEGRPDALIEVSHSAAGERLTASAVSSDGLTEGLVCSWPTVRVAWSTSSADRSLTGGTTASSALELRRAEDVRRQVRRPARLSSRTDAGDASTLEVLLTLPGGSTPERALSRALQALPPGVRPRALAYPESSFDGSVRPVRRETRHKGPRLVLGQCVRLSLAWDGDDPAMRLELLRRLHVTAAGTQLDAGLHVFPARSLDHPGQWMELRPGPDPAPWVPAATDSVVFTLVGGRSAPRDTSRSSAADQASEDRQMMTGLLDAGRLRLESFVGTSIGEHWVLSFVVSVDDQQLRTVRRLLRTDGEPDDRLVLLALLQVGDGVHPGLAAVLERYDVIASTNDAADHDPQSTAYPLWVQWEVPVLTTSRGSKKVRRQHTPGSEPAGSTGADAPGEVGSSATDPNASTSPVATHVEEAQSSPGEAAPVVQGPPDVLQLVLRRLQQEVAASVVLERVERTGRGTIRGRAKLAVDLREQRRLVGSERMDATGEHSLVRRLGTLAKDAQDDARRRLVHERGVEGSALSLAVVARDWWLHGWRGSV